MKFELKYGEMPSVLPTIPTEVLLEADTVALRVLIALASSPELREGGRDAVANLLGLTPAAADSALSFWRSHGILKKISSKNEEGGGKLPEKMQKPEKSGDEASQKTKKPEKRTKISELPAYTDSELADILEHKKSLSDLITEAQNTLGKIFNLNETKILVSIVEELGFDDEFMLILLDFCRRAEHKNMRYVEKLASALYDDGIRTPEALIGYLKRRERLGTAEGKIRTMFGLGTRALTETEKKHIAKWIDVYGFELAMIKKAYEITIHSTAKPSLNYAAKILENWYSEGYKTPDEVDAARAKREGEKGTATSYNVDDFFKAALDRSYSDTDTDGEDGKL